MKSVRTKLIASILICSLFTSVLIGVIAISNSVRTAGKDAMTMMQLTGQKKKTEELNSTIQKIEQSVDTLSEVAMSNFDYDSFRQSKDYADTYTETVQQAVLDFANHTNGAVTAYLRYNPNVLQSDHPVLFLDIFPRGTYLPVFHRMYIPVHA